PLLPRGPHALGVEQGNAGRENPLDASWTGDRTGKTRRTASSLRPSRVRENRRKVFHPEILAQTRRFGTTQARGTCPKAVFLCLFSARENSRLIYEARFELWRGTVMSLRSARAMPCCLRPEAEGSASGS